MFVTFSFEEGITQVSWQSELLNTGQYANLWRSLLSWYQETPAGILHLWYVMNRMLLLVTDTVYCRKKNNSHFLLSSPVSSGRCGSRVNRSFHDLRLHTW